MSGINSTPITALLPNGGTVNFLMDQNNKPRTASFIDNLKTPTVSQDTKQLEVSALYSDGTKTFGVGHQLNTQGKLIPTAWIYDGGWKIGESPATARKSKAVSKIGNRYLLADGSKIWSVNFKVNKNGQLEADGTSVSAKTEALSASSSLVMGSSTSAVGVWTSSNGTEWVRSGLGTPTKVYTGHLSTSFTFPGYAGSNAQVQRIYGRPRENGKDIKPADVWDLEKTDPTLEGYYGLHGSKVGGSSKCKVEVTWVQNKS